MRNPFLELLTSEDQQIPGTFWATVTGVSPLRIQRDGESVLAITPQSLVNLETGDRVLCLLEKRQVVVLGRLGGDSQNVIFINGVAYRATGHVPAPAYDWSGNMNGIAYGTINVPVPYQPPPGWTFQWSVGESSRWMVVANAERYPSNGTQAIRIMQFNNSALGHLTRLNWQLVTG